MLADAVCDVIHRMRQEGGTVFSSDIHGDEATRRVLLLTNRVKVQHAVLYRIVLTRALIQEWHRGGRGGDKLGHLSVEDGTKMLADARWDRHLQTPPFNDFSEEGLRCGRLDAPAMSTAALSPSILWHPLGGPVGTFA